MSTAPVSTAPPVPPAPPAPPPVAVPLREGVYGERVIAVEPGGIEVIPAAERHGRPLHLLWTWIAPNLEFATVYVGAIPVVLFGGGFYATAIALVFGTALGAAVHGVLSTWGPRFGIAQLVQSRAAFGFWGNALPAMLNTLTAGIGWFAVNSVSGAFAIITFASLVGWPAPGFTPALLIVVLVEIAVAFFGYNLVHRFQQVILPYLAVVFLACCAYIFAASHPGTGFSAQAPAAAGGAVGAFILAAVGAYSYASSWHPYAADYSRYLPGSVSPRTVAWCAGIGLFVSCALLEVAGAALATVPATAWGATDLPTAQFVKPLPHLLAVLATLGIAVGAIGADILNVYSAAMSFLSLGIRMSLRRRRAIVAVVFGVVGFAVARLADTGPGSTYENFLFLNVYWIVPFSVVVLTDYLLRRGRFEMAEFFDSSRRGVAGVVAFVAGVAASVPFWNQTLYTGWFPAHYAALGDLSPVAGAVTSATVYTVLWRLARRGGRARVGAAAGGL